MPSTALEALNSPPVLNPRGSAKAHALITASLKMEKVKLCRVEGVTQSHRPGCRPQNSNPVAPTSKPNLSTSAHWLSLCIPHKAQETTALTSWGGQTQEVC